MLPLLSIQTLEKSFSGSIIPHLTHSHFQLCSAVNLDECSSSSTQDDETQPIAGAQVTTYWEMVSPKEFANLESDDTRKSLTVVHKETVFSCVCPRLRYWKSIGKEELGADSSGNVIVTERFTCAPVRMMLIKLKGRDEALCNALIRHFSTKTDFIPAIHIVPYSGPTSTVVFVKQCVERMVLRFCFCFTISPKFSLNTDVIARLTNPFEDPRCILFENPRWILFEDPRWIPLEDP
jgi:hypothetical protein